MGIQQALQNVLTNPTYLAAWGALVAVSLAVLVWGPEEQLGTEEPHEVRLGFTVLYSGPFGLVGYWYSGRTQIDHDSFWRYQASRSGTLRINACGDCTPYGNHHGSCKARRGSRTPYPQGTSRVTGE